jgi:excisionase family DNA binding protein
MADLRKRLTVAEAADVLKVGAAQVLALIRARKLPAANIGLGPTRPRWRIDPADVQRFLDLAGAPDRPVPRRRRKREADFVRYFS